MSAPRVSQLRPLTVAASLGHLLPLLRFLLLKKAVDCRDTTSEGQFLFFLFFLSGGEAQAFEDELKLMTINISSIPKKGEKIAIEVVQKFAIV